MRVQKSKIKEFIMCLLVCYINFVILQSACRTINFCYTELFLYGVVNIGIMLAFVGILYGLLGELWRAELISCLLCAIYSIINEYVIEFHGSPLTIPEFQNVRTAVNVMQGYSLWTIKPLIMIALICFLFVIAFGIIMYTKKHEIFGEKGKRSDAIKRIIYVMGGGIYIAMILLSSSLLEPLNSTWNWKDTVGKYGYPLYFLTSAMDYEVAAPAGYSVETLESIPLEEYESEDIGDNLYPDIILILNESFYDISVVTDIETDIDYMGDFYELENSVSGHIVVPGVGGGTNNSEFELLTSNSLYLLPGITPFVALDMSDMASIVSNLNEMGYYTIGMHPAAKLNYGRNTGYSLLGFDEIHFDDDYADKEYYGSRKLVTDECAYDYMVSWYENAVQWSEQPIFSYLLTIQNHGGWDTNDASLDIVHIESTEYPSYENQLNEYLSCVSLSVSAFDKLIEYFQNSERRVIICMVGDHAPAFVPDISNENDRNDLLQRMVPFIIWANFSIEEESDVVYSMNELAPLLLDTAGVEMMPYYQYILKLGENVPILTSYGSYVDANGNIFSYEDDTEYREGIWQYFYLEYNNLQEESLEGWFNVE